VERGAAKGVLHHTLIFTRILYVGFLPPPPLLQCLAIALNFANRTLYLCIIPHLNSRYCLLIVCKLCVLFVGNILSVLCCPLGQVSLKKMDFNLNETFTWLNKG
jgi:hypothetical protein